MQSNEQIKKDTQAILKSIADKASQDKNNNEIERVAVIIEEIKELKTLCVYFQNFELDIKTFNTNASLFLYYIRSSSSSYCSELSIITKFKEDYNIINSKQSNNKQSNNKQNSNKNEAKSRIEKMFKIICEELNRAQDQHTKLLTKLSEDSKNSKDNSKGGTQQETDSVLSPDSGREGRPEGGSVYESALLPAIDLPPSAHGSAAGNAEQQPPVADNVANPQPPVAGNAPNPQQPPIAGNAANPQQPPVAGNAANPQPSAAGSAITPQLAITQAQAARKAQYDAELAKLKAIQRAMFFE